MPPLYAPHLPKVVLPINRAGSVGKTTAAVTWAVLAALRGYKVLFIDCDNQTDGSYCLTYDTKLLPASMATTHDLMLGKATLKEAIVPGRTRIADGEGPECFQVIENLDLVLGSTLLTQADGELVQKATGVFWLQRILRSQVQEGQYDLIILDPPASAGRFTVSLIIACSDIVACIRPTWKELRGVNALLELVDEVRTEFGDFDVDPQFTHLLAMTTTSHRSQGAVYDDNQIKARDMFGADKVMPGISQSILPAEAYEHQEPLPFWKPDAQIVTAFGEGLDMLGYPERAAA